MSDTENSPIENAVDVAVIALDQGVEHLNSLIYAAAAMAAKNSIDLADMAAKKQKEKMIEFMQEVKNGINQEIVEANKNIEAIRGIIGDPENHEFVNHMLKTGKEQLVEVYGIAGTGAELFKERMKAEGLHLQETLSNIAKEKGNELAERGKNVMQKANQRKEEAKEQLDKMIKKGEIKFTEASEKARELASQQYNETKQLATAKLTKMENMAMEKANQTIEQGTEMAKQVKEQVKGQVTNLKAQAKGVALETANKMANKATSFLNNITGTKKNQNSNPAEGGKRKNKTRKIRNKKKMKKA